MEMPKTSNLQRQFPGGNNSRRTFFVLIGVCVIALILFGLALWTNQDKKATEQLGESSLANANDENIGQTNINAVIAQMTDEQKELARIRDSNRLADIRSLRDALDKYKKDVGSYPQDLPLLKPRYLEEIPVNPVPGGQDYVYTPIGTEPYSIYDMSYSLEIGAEGVGPGEHIASSDGLATP
jgi:hypothetical protein